MTRRADTGSDTAASATSGRRVDDAPGVRHSRVIDAHAGIAKIDREGRCRLCGTRGRWPYLNRAHILSRAQGGDDVAENIIPLCGSGTTGCHHAVDSQRLARVRLRPQLHDDEVAYVVRRTSAQGRPGWLDARYPSPARAGGRQSREKGSSDA